MELSAAPFIAVFFRYGSLRQCCRIHYDISDKLPEIGRFLSGDGGHSGSLFKRLSCNSGNFAAFRRYPLIFRKTLRPLRFGDIGR